MATSYSNPGGQGDRTASITVTRSESVFGSLSGTVDGNTSSNAWFAFNNPNTGVWLEFDFGTPVVIDEFTSYHNGNAAYGNHKWQGWNGSSWVDIGGTFDWGGSNPFVGTSMSGNTTGYTKYRAIGVGSNQWGATDMREVEFKIGTPDAPVADLEAEFFDEATLDASITLAPYLTAEFLDEATMTAVLGGMEEGFTAEFIDESTMDATINVEERLLLPPQMIVTISGV